ncbi:MAG TPA: lamin tail domain-containing protein [Verrucomicrobiae bacterium]|nr:lamin tail domain-containing protein [Verrucomicrobiae bacterium]
MNEVQPDAFSGLTNGLGGLSPWIELYNSGPAVIALSDLYLADDYSNLLQSPFPNGSFVAPGEFKIIFADGQASFSTSNELHTTFALQNASGSLALSRTYNGQPLVLDFLDYAEVLPGRSYGSVPDGQGFDRRELAHSTPGSPNSSNIIATSVVVNEWMASNTQTIRNPIGNKPDDWFELYNPGNEFVDLSGYFLSDVETNRYKFKVPVGYAIPPRGFLLVWADNQNSSAGNDLHVNFKLSKAGTSIGLFAPNGDTADFVSFGAQSSDVSQGRYPDGGTEIVAMKPTPGSANVDQGGTLNLISPGDQLVYPGQTLTVRLQTSGATSDETLAYSFDSPAPPGAMVDAGSGVFTWTPPGGQIPGTNTITIRVSDNGSPPQSAAVSFNVIRLNSPKVTGEFENGSMLRLTWQSFSGKVYRLQSSEDITAPEWVTLGSGWTGTGNKIEVNLDISAAPRRFYRLILIP